MNVVFMAALMSVGADPQQGVPQPFNPPQANRNPTAASTMMDGDWILVYAEKEGHAMDAAKHPKVTIRGTTLTLTHDGHQKVLHMQFGPNHSFWTMAAGGGQPPTGRESGTRPANEPNRPVNPPQPPNPNPNPPATAPQPANPNPVQPAAPAQPGFNPAIRPATGNQPPAAVGGRNPAHGNAHGTYILSQEFLCLAMDNSPWHEEHRTGPARTGNAPPATEKPRTTTAPGAERTGANNPNPPPARGTPPAANSLGGAPAAANPMGTAPQRSGWVLILRKHRANDTSGQTHQR
jgi:hypothetical protein